MIQITVETNTYDSDSPSVHYLSSTTLASMPDPTSDVEYLMFPCCSTEWFCWISEALGDLQVSALPPCSGGGIQGSRHSIYSTSGVLPLLPVLRPLLQLMILDCRKVFFCESKYELYLNAITKAKGVIAPVLAKSKIARPHDHLWHLLQEPFIISE